ncbi:peroxiredoxin [Leptothoe spongobia]|uniref:thioredoxin-dependent peroxiredoxin n=1 Tax=Leptothoe spongobia TAU-MAC 1115 TaxID=1967444 RepID=A0A947DFI8_9CYAN|nr:peroxiredoxin [Leptothoe spongobia]MBT9315980.1 peroxiredoxin [Leptothoe spongobia TAU-MAC 1115]
MTLVLVRRFVGRLILPVLLAFGLLVGPSAPAHALGGEQVPLGEPAPNFTLPTNVGDGEISLSDYLGQWVVLYFYPKDFTPGCTLEAQRFQRDLPEFMERNAQVIGVSADDVDSHAEFCDSEGLKFPLLADADGAVSRAYGSWMKPMSMRHTYLVDPNGTMQERFLGVRPAIHSQEVLTRLDELQQA